MSLTNRILLAMTAGIVIGSALEFLLGRLDSQGVVAQFLSQFVINGVADVIGRIFIASLKLLVVPLVLVSLICGMTSLGSSSRMGAIAGRTIGLYIVTTAIAVSLGLLGATLIGPGNGLSIESSASFTPKAAPPLTEVIVNIFPSNPFSAMAKGEMLQVIVFALLVGFALTRAGDAGQRIAAWFRDMEAVVMKMVGVLIEMAPWGVFALLLKLFATMGFATIIDLAAYFFTLAGLLIFHALVVYPLVLRSLTKLNPGVLLSKMRPVWAFAFSTSSSGATLPVTLRTVEKRLGVPKSVAGFSIPLGATINMDGTAIMQGVATVFIAQVYGIDLTASQLLMVILTASLASIGTAAVPGVGLITLSLVLTQAGLPVEGVALIIGVDRLLDMIRTAVNVTGDAMVSTVVAYREGQLDETIYNDPNADADTHVATDSDATSTASVS
jgi:Na+/H+-dicarboxylate symporter